MKTTNKIQKTALTAFTAAVLTIISLSLNAQFEMNSYIANNETGHNAMAMGKNNNNYETTTLQAGNYTDANRFAAYLAQETEEPLQLEEWMVSETSFATMPIIEAETENPLELEDWMTNETIFDVSHVFLATETEEELELEDWMINNNLFNVSNLDKTDASEKAVTKKSGTRKSKNAAAFTATNYGRRTLIIGADMDTKLKTEAWMFNNNNWK